MEPGERGMDDDNGRGKLSKNTVLSTRRSFIHLSKPSTDFLAHVLTVFKSENLRQNEFYRVLIVSYVFRRHEATCVMCHYSTPFTPVQHDLATTDQLFFCIT